jgi:flagellar hook-associated protein 1
MSFYGLSLAGSALSAYQSAANVTSDDIANANTPGASRQIVDLTEAPPITGTIGYPAATVPGTMGDGVTVQAIERIHQDSYDALYRGASSSQNYFSVQQDQLNAIQAALSEPTNGINAAFSGFQTAISTLAAQSGSSGSTSAADAVIGAAQTLTTALNSASTTITQRKATVMQQATSLVTQANSYLDQIAALNGEIRAARADGENPNTYSDQRDQLIDKLSTVLSTQTSIQPNGSALVTVNGRALVNDTVAYHLAPPTVGQAPDGSPVFKVDFATNPPASPTAAGIPLGSGQLAGLADVYNNKLTSYASQLDNFASSLANEVNRVTQAGYVQGAVAGTAMFQASVPGEPITAGNIAVAIDDPAQVTTALASTAAGNLVVPMNASNNTVITSAQLQDDTNLAYPPAAALTGTLTVTVDGVNQTFTYNTGTTDATIDQFMAHFNAAHLGVSASFDGPAQKIVFARDPANEDLVHRAAQAAAATPTDPSFTITDSNAPPAPPPPPGTPSTSLLQTLGAGAISGITQSNQNVPGVSAAAVGTGDNAAATALLAALASNVGVPAIQTRASSAIGAGTQTIAPAGGLGNIAVGQTLTIDATPGGGFPQENVVVTAVNKTAGTFTATFANAHGAGASIASAPTQTLSQYYSTVVTNVGFDAQTAITGTQTQTQLAQSIDTVRQGVDGINLDEETQNLIKFQTSYQAAAKVVSVMETLLNTVITNLGVQ